MKTDFLILGSTGMLGSALMTGLKANGYSVQGAARSDADICIDVTDDEQLRKALATVNPATIINTVAIVDLAYCESNPGHSYECNARVSRKLAEYATSSKTKYIYISTDHYFTGDGAAKHDEHAALNLCNEYAATKFIGEQFALQNKNALVLRTNIVGFRAEKKANTFVEWVISALKNQEAITLYENFYTSSIDVYNFTEILLDLLNKNATGVFNVASSEVTNKEFFIKALAEKLDLSTDRAKCGPMPKEANGVIRNESLGLDVSKAEKLLGYKLPDLKKVLETLCKHYQNNGVAI
ncbi:sugar nucleotide-binding protein [Desulfovibrio sp. JC022]|uniref:SDR family oxidoreductase n=1 Tax=Desulfovibrio sp. JC022 TaxID=2593642 RepID=UPI0013D39386|nr:sugar nucleotide-binding protein [Desulfovibrio sp. JC022]NDV22162.1 sugar nucleotide-binding protein [Desulfovibrio sp. JC022]